MQELLIVAFDNIKTYSDLDVLFYIHCRSAPQKNKSRAGTGILH
jgi:hypothetical protein